MAFQKLFLRKFQIELSLLKMEFLKINYVVVELEEDRAGCGGVALFGLM
jgi:hypothetical protein